MLRLPTNQIQVPCRCMLPTSHQYESAFSLFPFSYGDAAASLTPHLAVHMSAHHMSENRMTENHTTENHTTENHVSGTLVWKIHIPAVFHSMMYSPALFFVPSVQLPLLSHLPVPAVLFLPVPLFFLHYFRNYIHYPLSRLLSFPLMIVV